MEYEKKRKRSNGTYRWNDQATIELLQNITDRVTANPELFEKPTAQKFYESISLQVPVLRKIKWDVSRSKMRNLKNSYLAAIQWKNQTGAGLLENGEEKSVQAYIDKLCPHYNYLEAIFGQRVNIRPPAIFESSQLHNTQSLEGEASYDVEFLQDDDAENDLLSVSMAEPNMTQQSSEEPNMTQQSSEEPNMTQQSINSTQSSAHSSCSPNNSARRGNRKRTHNSSAFALLFDIQKQKVDIEKEKVEIERMKEVNRYKIRKLELEKEERVEMEKLRLESQERLTKFEMELRNASN